MRFPGTNREARDCGTAVSTQRAAMVAETCLTVGFGRLKLTGSSTVQHKRADIPDAGKKAWAPREQQRGAAKGTRMGDARQQEGKEVRKEKARAPPCLPGSQTRLHIRTVRAASPADPRHPSTRNAQKSNSSTWVQRPSPHANSLATTQCLLPAALRIARASRWHRRRNASDAPRPCMCTWPWRSAPR